MLGQGQASLHYNLILARVDSLDAGSGAEGGADNAKPSNVRYKLRTMVNKIYRRKVKVSARIICLCV
ncbi:hypothetical protein DF3PB_4030003 [uncultured Defluviicoccus sp.]|uniref:Uncharacterized protein n=1 Tax=metagenome TaxID=256318 RepID=A0A380TFQ8_9ZZZZ|nr:hypothetical protein DF3PB_4030003 [uncultured Defluviicoccus sp.]